MCERDCWLIFYISSADKAAFNIRSRGVDYDIGNKLVDLFHLDGFKEIIKTSSQSQEKNA